MRRRPFVAFAFLASLPASVVLAQQEGASRSDEAEELDALMEVLAEETAIATRTKLNSDFVPGTVTVLQGDEMEALGARTVAEALTFVPGVFALHESIGTPIVTVRGVIFRFNSGNIKILVDGIAMTQQSAALNSSALMLPMELVERLEFIRGPGSTVHGDFAFVGLLNIVTREEGRRAFLHADGFETLGAGALLWFEDASKEHRFGVDLYGLTSRDAPAVEGSEAEETRFAGSAAYRYRGFRASFHLLRRERDQDGTRVADEHNAVLQLRHVGELSSSLESDARVSLLQNVFDFPETDFDGTRFGVEWDLTWRGMSRNTWLLAVDYGDTAIDEAIHTPPLPEEIRPAPEDASGTHRRLLGLSLQDQIELGKAFTLTLGVRYERLDGNGEVSPRVALVWRATEHQILKAQYAEGYRAANFFELYGTGERNDDLEPENVETTELSYVYRGSSWLVRATLFRSELSDLIQPAAIPPPGEPTLFGNVAEAEATGGEVEWEQQLTPIVKLLANLSYSDVEDERPFGVGAAWIGNLALIVRPWERLLASAHWYHVGERASQTDTPVDGFDLLDVTLTLTDVPVGGLVFRAGAKNVLDDDVLLLLAAPGAQPTTPAFDARTFWAQASYRF